MATRKASGQTLVALAARLPELVGGSGDLAPSNNTLIPDGGSVAAGRFEARNLHFGVREHGMGAVLNGIALHGGLRPYGGTFLIFSDYMRPAIRLAALMRLPVIYVFTHDSIGLGEDGPTHQPVEHLAALRAIPGLSVVRPADATETAEAWRLALARTDGPTALVLTRQDLPVLDRRRFAPAAGLARGGYILAEAEIGRPALVLVAHRVGSRSRAAGPHAARGRRHAHAGRIAAVLGSVRRRARRLAGRGPAPHAAPGSPWRRGRPSVGNAGSGIRGQSCRSSVSGPRRRVVS